MQLVQKVIENTGNSPMFVSGTMIPPGESRVVEVPGAAVPLVAEAAPTTEETVRVFLKGTVKDCLAALANLSIEALGLALQLEVAGANRKSLLEALNAEQVRRADEQLKADQARQRADAIDAARQQLAEARVELEQVPADAPAADREAAQALVDEAQAKVDALVDADKG